MLLSKQTSTNVHRFPIHWLILGFALLALGGAIGYSIIHEYNRIDLLERERLTTQAKVVDANLERQLVALNSALMGIRDDLPYWKAQKDSKALLNRHLRAMSDAIPGIRTIVVTDAKGTISASNQKQLIGLNFHEREYFRAPRQGLNPAMLYISPPFKSVLGVYIMNVTMVVLDTRDMFAGIISVSLDPDYFSVLLNSVLYTPGMRASLIHGDGKIFLEAPNRKDLSGMDLAKPGSRFTLHVKSGQTANLFAAGRAYSTGDERMSAWRTIRPASLLMDKPLMISVNRDLRGIFASWRREAFLQGGLYGVLFLAAVFGLYVYQRRQQKYDCLAADYTAELQKSEENYRSLFQNASIGIFHSLPEGKFLRVNPALAKMLGYGSPEEMISAITNISTQIYIDSKKHSNLLAAVAEQTDWVYAENRYRRKNGAILTANLAVRKVLNSENTAVYLEGFVEDITERKMMEEALRKSEEKFRLLVENSHDIIYSLTADGVFIFVSPAWTALLGHPANEVAGKPFQPFVHPDDIPGCMVFLKSVIETGQPQDGVEYRVRHTDGTWYWHTSSAVPFKDEAGTVIGFYGIASDITERKKEKEGLKDLVSKLQKAIEEIKTLRGIVPICAGCKKIRDDKGFWEHVEAYVAKHTEAQFSHGICPDCMEKLYPEFGRMNKPKNGGDVIG